jgi:CBS domain-containing protein
LRVERTGPHRNTVNIKLNALAPVVDAARLAALEAHLYTTATLERLRELQGPGSFLAPHAPDMEQAFEFIMGLRLRHQHRQRQEGKDADNFVAPDRLGALERRTLQESFRLIRNVQHAIGEHFRAWMVQ